MICGVMLIIASAALAVYNSIEDRNAGKASEEVLHMIQSQEQETVDSEYIGYLTIPALGLELPVMSEWDYDRLKIAPCLYYGSVEENHMVIAAHNYSCHFGRISQLNFGDTVIFTDMAHNSYNYTVGDIETLGPLDTEEMIDSDWNLTLYTCTYSGAERITVRCKRDSSVSE